MKKYIPKSKDDINALSELHKCLFKNISKDAMVLLEWMQDMHWDVAHSIAKYFQPHINQIENEILIILSSNDNEWKYNILFFLIMQSPEVILTEKLKSELARIAFTPSLNERNEELNVLALEILNSK